MYTDENDSIITEPVSINNDEREIQPLLQKKKKSVSCITKIKNSTIASVLPTTAYITGSQVIFSITTLAGGIMVVRRKASDGSAYADILSTMLIIRAITGGGLSAIAVIVGGKFGEANKNIQDISQAVYSIIKSLLKNDDLTSDDIKPAITNAITNAISVLENDFDKKNENKPIITILENLQQNSIFTSKMKKILTMISSSSIDKNLIVKKISNPEINLDNSKPIFDTINLLIQQLGKDVFAECGKTMWQGKLLSLCYCIPAITIMLDVPIIYPLMHQPETVTEKATEFFRIFPPAKIAIALYTANQMFSYGLNKQSPILLANLISTGTFFIATPFLIPKFGLNGLAISLNIQAWTDLLATEGIFVLQLFFSKSFRQFKPFRLKNLIPNWKILHQEVKIGFPTAAQTAFELANIYGSSMLVGTVGEQALIMWNVFAQYQLFLVAPLYSMSIAASILVAISNGGGNPKQARNYGNVCLIIGGMLASGILVVFLIFPKQLMSPYIDIHNSNNKQMVAETCKLLAVMGVTNFFDVLRNISTSSLRGLFDTFWPMIINGGSLGLIGLGSSTLLYFLCENKVLAVAIGQSIGFATASTLTTGRWLYKSWGLDHPNCKLSNYMSTFFQRKEQNKIKKAEKKEDNKEITIIKSERENPSRGLFYKIVNCQCTIF